MRLNSACGYHVNPVSGGFRHVLFRRYWRHDSVSILALLPFCNDHKEDVNEPEGAVHHFKNVQLLIGSRTSISCYLLRHPQTLHHCVSEQSKSGSISKAAPRVSSPGGGDQHEYVYRQEEQTALFLLRRVC